MANTDVVIVDIHDPRALQAEAALDAAHFPLPLPSRGAWGQHFDGDAHKLAIAADASGQVLAAVGLELTRTHALPGHHILRVQAFGDPYATTVGEDLLAEIVRYAAAHGKVLRVVVELECRAESGRELLRRALVSLGFRQVRAERIPACTLVLDLTPSEEDIFATFGKSTRYEVRKAAKLGLELFPLTDPVYGARMNTLLAETFARTGGEVLDKDWGPIMAISRELPHRSRLVGVFHGPVRAPEKLLAYAWSIHHGERAVYDTGASVRIPGVRIPLLYPAIWDLITWAKREGAKWFDLGGVTPGSRDSDDALGRISDFKRRFSREEIALGEEWIYEPSVLRASVAHLASAAARRVGRLFQSFPSRVRQS
jgi:hypothetical protein